MPETKPVCRPWRRFLRLSVRGLIVLVLVIGGWLGWLVRTARTQRDAVVAIKIAGGHVAYNWEWKDGDRVLAAEPWAPRWLVSALGVGPIGRIGWIGQPSSFGAAGRAGSSRSDAAISRRSRAFCRSRRHILNEQPTFDRAWSTD